MKNIREYQYFNQHRAVSAAFITRPELADRRDQGIHLLIRVMEKEAELLIFRQFGFPLSVQWITRNRFLLAAYAQQTVFPSNLFIFCSIVFILLEANEEGVSDKYALRTFPIRLTTTYFIKNGLFWLGKWYMSNFIQCFDTDTLVSIIFK